MTIMPKIKDVLQLTRDGRLAEATALLREGLLRLGAAPAEPASNSRDSAALKNVGSSWTLPAATEAERPEAQALQPGRFVWREIATSSGRRRYKLYVPEGLSTTPRPLVLMLHGCTQSPDDFAIGTGMNVIADEMGLLVVYPEQTSAHNASKCWNWFKPGDQCRGGGEAALLAAIPADVAREMAVDGNQVFVAGLSAGGAAAAVLAHEYPDVFRAAGIHSGLACGAARDLPSALTAMKRGSAGRSPSSTPTPTIVFHGTADRTVNPANARHVISAVVSGLAAPILERGRTPSGSVYTRERWRDAAGRPRAEVWTIEGAGHAWSGGSSAGSYTDPRGPNASRAMIEFFLSQ